MDPGDIFGLFKNCLLKEFVLCYGLVPVIVLVVVVTQNFNAKMVLANFECNLKYYIYIGTPRKGSKKVTCLLWERRGSGPEKQ